MTREERLFIEATPTLSALIRVAVKDLKAVKSNPTYKIDLDTWHRPTHDGPCLVCLAGAVMAVSCDADRGECMYPSDYHLQTRSRLLALDRVRLGDIWEAYYTMLGYRAEEEVADHEMPPLDSPDFIPALEAIADELEEKGL